MANRYVMRLAMVAIVATLVLGGLASVVSDGGGIVFAAPGDNGKSDKPDKDKPGKPDDDKAGKDKPEKTPKPDTDKGKSSEAPGKQIDPPQSTTDAYTVDLTCGYDAAADRSTCVATGTSPAGAAPIGDLLIDTAAVCAPLVGGNYLITPPSDGSEIDGYGLLGDAAEVVLVFDGNVTVGSSATYWLSVDGSWIPAAGVGLVCPPPVDAESTPEAVEVPTTGAIVATLYSCPSPADDGTEPDWFGTCQVMDSTLAPSLVDVGTGADLTGVGEATGAGQTTWSTLDPGTYDLSVPDASWCHAESDNVNSESDLVVEADTTTSVWLFFCSESSDGS